jgi:hypothetical protein
VPIGKHSVTWPHGSDVLATVRVVQEHATVVTVSVDAVVVAGIVGVGNVDGRVDDARMILVLMLMPDNALVAYGM